MRDMDPIMAALQQAALLQHRYQHEQNMNGPGLYPMMALPGMDVMNPANLALPLIFPGPLVQDIPPQACQQNMLDDENDSSENQRTLYLGNLSEQVSDEILYEIFVQAGPIESARIPKDKSGRQRNFGFVTYSHAITIPFALELYEGLELFHKKLTIKQLGSEKEKQHGVFNSPAFSMPINQTRLVNPFSVDLESATSLRKQYDNKPSENSHRRRGDNAISKHSRPRPYPQHNSGGNRRSEQRHSSQHGRRR